MYTASAVHSRYRRMLWRGSSSTSTVAASGFRRAKHKMDLSRVLIWKPFIVCRGLHRSTVGIWLLRRSWQRICNDFVWGLWREWRRYVTDGEVTRIILVRSLHYPVSTVLGGVIYTWDFERLLETTAYSLSYLSVTLPFKSTHYYLDRPLTDQRPKILIIYTPFRTRRRKIARSTATRMRRELHWIKHMNSCDMQERINYGPKNVKPTLLSRSFTEAELNHTSICDDQFCHRCPMVWWIRLWIILSLHLS